MIRHPSLSSTLLLFSLAVVPHLAPSPPPPLPRLLPLSACRPFPPTYSSLSLYRAPHPYPLTCCLPACLVSSLLHPLFRLSLFQVGFFFFYLMVPGWVWVSRLLLGLPLPWLSRRLCVCFSLSCSRSYLRLASLSPASPTLSTCASGCCSGSFASCRFSPFFRVLYLSLLSPPLAVGYARFSCCSRFVCFCAFFPLTLTVTPCASLLLVFFLFFFPPAPLMSPSLPLPCGGRGLSSLMDGSSLGFLPHPDTQ